MFRVRHSQTLGIVLAALVPVYAGAQHRGQPATSSGTVGAPYPRTIPPIRMGSLPQSNGINRPWGDGRTWDRAGQRFGSGFGNRPLHLLAERAGGSATSRIGDRALSPTMFGLGRCPPVPFGQAKRQGPESGQTEVPKSRDAHHRRGADGGGVSCASSRPATACSDHMAGRSRHS